MELHCPASVLKIAKLFLSEPYVTKQGGNYRRMNDYTEGMAIATNANITVKGELLSNRLAELKAKTGGKFQISPLITVSPLSLDTFKPDTAALRNIKESYDCNLILKLLDGESSGHVVAAEVLHGQIRYNLTLNWGTNFDASGQSTIIASITKVFGIKQAEISTSTNTVSFTVAAFPAPQTLGIVPERLSFEELARITNYLQGKRGADLENAVNAALIASDVAEWEKWRNVIQSILGNEIANKERWAENFVSGKRLIATDIIKRERAGDLRNAANYAAGMELIR
jgi:hypothetical protein